MCVSTNAVSLEYSQTSVITDYNTNIVGTSYENIVLGSSNNKNIGSRTGDFKAELRGMVEPVYILIDNPIINNTFNITYINDNPIKINSSGRNATTQELTMQEKGIYYFKINPSFEGESVDFLIDFKTPVIATVFLQEQHPKGFNSLMAGVVTSFLEIISINITFWRIAFYTVITTLIVSFILLIFGGAFYVFKWSQKVREQKGFFSGGGRK